MKSLQEYIMESLNPFISKLEWLPEVLMDNSNKLDYWNAYNLNQENSGLTEKEFNKLFSNLHKEIEFAGYVKNIKANDLEKRSWKKLYKEIYKEWSSDWDKEYEKNYIIVAAEKAGSLYIVFKNKNEKLINDLKAMIDDSQIEWFENN